MKRRVWRWVLGSLVVVGVFAGVWFANSRYRDDIALREQLELAWSEGLPTNWQQFASLVPTAEPHENAAPFYAKLAATRYRPERGAKAADVNQLIERVCFVGDEASLQEAALELERAAAALKLVDEAVQLPKCWFDRDWSEGAALLSPEYADMKFVGRVVLLRGTMAARKGDVAQALQDLDNAKVLASHAAYEGVDLGKLVAHAIHYDLLSATALWALAFRDPQYNEQLAELARSIPDLHPRDAYRSSLSDLLSLIELCSTQAGIKELGLDGAHPLERATFFVSKARAKAEIVKGHRKCWAALDLPPEQLVDAFERVEADWHPWAFAFPTAAEFYFKLITELDPVNLLSLGPSKRAAYGLLAEKLAEGPLRITSEPEQSLVGIVDIRYTFDGRTVTVEATYPGAEPFRVRLPRQLDQSGAPDDSGIRW